MGSGVNLVDTFHNVLKLLFQLVVLLRAADALLVFFKHASVYNVDHLLRVGGIYIVRAPRNFWQKMIRAFYYWQLVCLNYKRVLKQIDANVLHLARSYRACLRAKVGLLA